MTATLDPAPLRLSSMLCVTLMLSYLSLFSASFCASDKDNTENILAGRETQYLLITFRVILNLRHKFSIFTIHRFHIGFDSLIF